MAISYQSKDDAVLGLQLKVQEICAKKSDVAIVSVSGLDVTIDIKETLKQVRCAIHCDDSIGLSLIAQAGITYPDSKDPVSGAPTPSVPGGSRVTLALSHALADEDALVVKYVIAE
jgi:hypothetical protein